MLEVKNLPANTGDARHVGSITGLGRSPGVRNGNLLQYSYLEDSMEPGGLQCMEPQSRTRHIRDKIAYFFFLSDLSTTKRYDLTPVRVTLIKKNTNNKCW